MNTEITGVRFSGKVRWGGEEEKDKEDRFKIIEKGYGKRKSKRKMVIHQKTSL